MPSLVADYWLERPDGAGLVQLAFATPMLLLRQPLLELFDAVAAAPRWVTADEPEMTTAPGPVHSPSEGGSSDLATHGQAAVDEQPGGRTIKRRQGVS
jgi:hypothetical protein